MRPLVLVTAALLALVPARARADDKDEARALVQTGVSLLNKKDYRGALSVFKDAYTKYRSAKILLNIGTTLKALGRDNEAANTYQAYLDASDTDPSRKGVIDALLADLDKKLARIALTVLPADAEVQINLGDWMPAAEAHLLRVAPGSFAVKARKPGFAPAERRGDAAIGTRVDVSIHLIEEPPEEDLTVVDANTTTATPVITAPAEPLPERARARLGATVGVHIDPANKGAAATVGAVFAVIPRVEVNAAALLGPNQGGYLGATIYVLTGTWRPTVTVGAPMFFSHGARVSARGAAGLEVVASRHLSLVAEVGVERALNPEPDIDKWSFIPSIAVHGRL